MYDAAHNNRKGKKNSTRRVNLIMLCSEINNKYPLSEIPLYSIFHQFCSLLFMVSASEVNGGVFMTAQ